MGSHRKLKIQISTSTKIKLSRCDPGRYKYVGMDLNKSIEGAPGQNMPTPSIKHFGTHVIVEKGSMYYDPSYGISAVNASDYTPKAINACEKDFGGGDYRWRKAAGLEVGL